MRSVAFINQGVGDVIMHFPLVRSLVSEPSDELLVVTRSAYEQEVVALGVSGAGRLRYAAVRAAGESTLGAAIRLARTMRAHKPECVVLGADVHPHYGALFALVSGAKMRIGPAVPGARRFFTHTIPPRDPTTHSVHNVHRACRLASLAGRVAEPNVRVALDAKRVRQLADPLLAPANRSFIGVALGSGVRETHKRLPSVRARALIAALTERFPDVCPLLLGGPPEVELNASLAAVPSFRGIDLTDRTPPETLLSVLSSCRVLISTCNGVSHFAAAAGTPVIGLFGPTNRMVTGPFGVLFEAISRELPCSPCYRRGYRYGCGAPICMDIEVNRIIAAVASLLDAPVRRA